MKRLRGLSITPQPFGCSWQDSRMLSVGCAAPPGVLPYAPLLPKPRARIMYVPLVGNWKLAIRECRPVSSPTFIRGNLQTE